MKFFLLLFSILAVLVSGCMSTPQQSTEANQSVLVATPQGWLGKALKAHGSLETWQSLASLEFRLRSESGERVSEETILTDLRSRHELITGADYQMGYDGKSYWQKLDRADMDPKNPVFMANLQFYFFAMPFVLADPGVFSEDLGKRSLAGKEYEVVQAGFADGTGIAPGDQYLLYLEPETGKLTYLLYSVTYFDEENAENYNAIHYSEWQEVEGLLVPKVMERYGWDVETQSLGNSKGSKSFPKVAFGKESPSADRFAPPEGAMIAD